MFVLDLTKPCIMSLSILSLTLLEPFEVGFVETQYTVMEGMGSVEVCVNLTKPGLDTDILDQFVVVEVSNFPSSVYIPADVTLASE